MKTILRSATAQVIIGNDATIIIGEKINPTGNKKLAAALQTGDFDFVRNLAIRQVQAGAQVLDINVGLPGIDEVKLLPRVVQAVTTVVTVPLCLDSANPAALAAALAVAPGKPLINSVNGEAALLHTILPVVKERGAAVIGLTLDDRGIPTDVDSRVRIAGTILERAAQIGLPIEDVVIDPLVLTVGTDTTAPRITLKTIVHLRKQFGVNINLGASNVSFGLPDRHIINEAFLALAIGAGANCLITDSMKLTGLIRAADLLMGYDNYAARYIAHFRAQQKAKAV